MGILLSILGFLAKVFAAFSPPRPSEVSVVSKEAGADETKLDNSEAANAEISTAVDARAANDAARVQPNSPEANAAAHWRD